MIDTKELRSIETDDMPNMISERRPYLALIGQAADEIDANRKRIAEQDARIAELEKQAASKDARIIELRAAVESKPIDLKNKNRYYACYCPECGWVGMSNDADGGHSIADTGDYSDVICPNCNKRNKSVLVEDADIALKNNHHRIAELEAELAKRPVMGADKWEADHQRTALEAHGLTDEFPYGCDAIDHVAGALVEARTENAKLRRVIGEIPEGDSCDGCSNITDRFNGDDQCSLFYLNEVGERCKSCLATFPNGNKGE